MRTILSTFIIFSLIVSAVSSDENVTETIVLAIDVSKSMRLKLDGVKTAAGEFIEKLDTQKGFRVVVIQFGTFADVVAERVVETEADKDYLKSIIRALRADQPDTNFDEALDKIELKIRRLGAGSASILLYSDGISDPTPGSGKPVMSLEELASKKFPVGRFSVYLINLNPRAVPTPEDMLDGMRRPDGSYSTINVRPKDLQMVTSQIRADIESKFDEMMKKLEEQPAIKKAKPSVPKPEPNPVLGFLRDNWKLFALISGLTALSALGYAVWWAFIQEDPKVKNRQNQRTAQPRRAKLSVVGEQNRAYIANTTTGSLINIGNGIQCQLRLDVADPIAAALSFRNGRAYLERKGRTPVQINGQQMVQKQQEIAPGDAFTVGDYTLRYELVSTNSRTLDDLQELLGPYTRNTGRQL